LHLNILGNGDREKAGEFFVALFSKYRDLVSSREATHALGHAHWWLPREAVTAWMELLREKSPQAFGEMFTLVALTHPEWDEMWDQLRSDVDKFVLGSDVIELVRGVAFSASNLWRNERFRERATELLCSIIPAVTEDLAYPILDVFRTTDEFPPGELTRRLLATLLANPKIFGFEKSRNFIADRLLGLLPFEAGLVGQLALAIVDAWGRDMSDVRTGMASVAPEVVNLALTLHRMGGDARELGMRLFERLLELEAYGAREALFEIDERETSSLPSRPRIPRRRRARRGAS
jgi:hypothetical protein